MVENILEENIENLQKQKNDNKQNNLFMTFDEVKIKTVDSALGFTVGDKVKVIDKNHNINKELYIIFITEYEEGKYFFHCAFERDRKIVRYYFGVNQIKKV